MKTSIEKDLFLLSVRHALIAIYFLVIPFAVPIFYHPSPLSIALIALFITHNLAESIIWFYKSRKIRKHQSGDLLKRGQLLSQLVQRVEQLIILGFVILLINEWIQGRADLSTLSFTLFLLTVVFLQHVQFYYVQLFFKTSSWFTYVPSLQKARPSYMARERNALKRS
ncbi:hypothetical protein BA81_16659 [Bacillus safensis FO-36b]|uniref:hypothetical protein n=1 Tax=Bacillus TaxID=1386 RepID=UPI00045C9EAD|nr:MULTISPECIES: hypothetical protein [Bacillus]ARD55396.1 hypothetical protein BRL64_04015 [Bacillus safensis]AWI35943.1 hypothetical protein RS87_04225 [Bacillus safensis FO-36b]KDE26101.1 hypothetical protein BA81_16659 [Bacillus safensis FO-36b]KIL23547.1 hypothetical protein B4134_0857 [Bacillus safensis]MBU8606468.1 hypothetical protein [Bacillus safensis]